MSISQPDVQSIRFLNIKTASDDQPSIEYLSSIRDSSVEDIDLYRIQPSGRCIRHSLIEDKTIFKTLVEDID